jgi:DNA-binding NarL/FixJ family response regulator
VNELEFRRRVLVVEDEPLLRGLISSRLHNDGFSVSSAGSAAEARRVAKDFDPDFAVLDIELGDGPNGIDLAQILGYEFPSISIVFLTHLPEPRILGLDNRSIPKNAAYLVKERIADPGVLSEAIEAVARRRVNPNFRDDKSKNHAFSGVSASQLEVLRMIAQGKSNHEIARERETTVRAVENLINRALEAANIDSSSSGNARVLAAREFIRIAGLPSRN